MNKVIATYQTLDEAGIAALLLRKAGLRPVIEFIVAVRTATRSGKLRVKKRAYHAKFYCGEHGRFKSAAGLGRHLSVKHDGKAPLGTRNNGDLIK